MAEEGENEDGTVGEDDVKTTDDLDKRGSRGVEGVRLMREAQERAGGASRDTSFVEFAINTLENKVVARGEDG